MAGIEYNELQGHQSILKAVEYLRMLPEWKAKPGKLRTGHIEYTELIARHLVNLYCSLEGVPLTEKIDLNETLDPMKSERFAQEQLQAVEASVKAYIESLNEWHLKLAAVRDVVGHVFDELDRDSPDWMHATASICQEKLNELVETCPFPSPAA